MQGFAGHEKSFDFLANETSLGIDGIVRLFDLDHLGVPPDSFVNELNPTFLNLPWDYYDSKNKQVEFLKNHYPQHRQTLAQFSKDFNWNLATLNDVSELVDKLSTEKRIQFELIRPYRKRAVASYIFKHQKNWEISRVPTGLFHQEFNPFNKEPRLFAEMSNDVARHPLFVMLLERIAVLLESVRPSALEIKVHCHQVSVVCHPDWEATNAPEGIHQDGADFIISALVIQRKNVTGGESVLYGPDKKKVLFRHTLQVGQGIFQSDWNSPLYHDVTPIACLDPLAGQGVRNLFGFDFQIIR